MTVVIVIVLVIVLGALAVSVGRRIRRAEQSRDGAAYVPYVATGDPRQSSGSGGSAGSSS